ncbi:PPR containing plant-like protein [Medicago truncatula]|uniref:PPR containing plant-like protein n=1 Tax=Medicago truncatula TaxID=3880 RepID=A2Q3R2_MEDTR|nr:Pentatricopeptide repeat [Medicago truncatula]KEH21630.1 PPR containing plant-like protein [Medicago truncatula]
MEEMKVSPNVVTYTVLIDGHIKIYNFEKAMRFFNETIDQGLKPDRVTYTALIWGLLNGRQKELAIIYYYEMSTKGMAKPCIFQVVTETSFIIADINGTRSLKACSASNKSLACPNSSRIYNGNDFDGR